MLMLAKQSLDRPSGYYTVQSFFAISTHVCWLSFESTI